MPLSLAAADVAALPYAPTATTASIPTAEPPQFEAPFASSAGAASSSDLSALKQAISLAQSGRASQAGDIAGSINDPVARKLAEWMVLRSDNSDADFARYYAFINANPSWPSISMFRRRAEAMLWNERQPSSTVRAFFGQTKPLSARGRMALARALISDGERNAAVAYIRETWRDDPLSRDLEQQIEETFDGMLTSADYKARMDTRLYADDNDGALRAAQKLGGTAMAIARARIAVNANSSNAKALLDEVPSEARRDAGYMFSRIQWLRRKDQLSEAAQLMLAAPRDPDVLRDTDDWWVERRLIARKLLDEDQAQAAYRIARDAAPAEKDNYRVDEHFTAGWIALRFLNEPNTAYTHFSRISGADADNPHAISRGGYWQGRALEAMGRDSEARSHYETAARYPTTYYGQLARARIGQRDVVLRPPPGIGAERRASLARLEVVRAVEMLYAIDERNLVIPFTLDLVDRTQDISALVAMADLATRNRDARAATMLGKAALERGYAFEHYAFPTHGIPSYRPIGPEVEQSLVYAIARQESTFHPTIVSPAKAYGLMQVTAPAAKYIAKRNGGTFDQKRLMSDPVYNVQMGAAELGMLLDDYNGSYIMTFVGYNAGRGRVKQWVAAYGDPRDPKVDPIDWVERIPFAETRNYVARIMENLQVYRARFAGSSRLTIESDLRRGGVTAAASE